MLFEYDEEDTKDPSFIGIFCVICENEIGYGSCPDCGKEEDNA